MLFWGLDDYVLQCFRNWFTGTRSFIISALFHVYVHDALQTFVSYISPSTSWTFAACLFFLLFKFFFYLFLILICALHILFVGKFKETFAFWHSVLGVWAQVHRIFAKRTNVSFYLVGLWREIRIKYIFNWLLLLLRINIIEWRQLRKFDVGFSNNTGRRVAIERYYYSIVVT